MRAHFLRFTAGLVSTIELNNQSMIPRGSREKNQFCILKKSVNFTLVNKNKVIEEQYFKQIRL